MPPPSRAETAAELLRARRAGLAERREAHARARAAASAAPLHRRRGAELEAAILDAAWDEVTASGYSDLTYERVAYRAGTSRSVVYRRWSTKKDLVLAAIAHRGADAAVGIEDPDTGSLREDLLALLRRFNRVRAESMVLFGTLMSSFFKETGISPATARRSWVGDRDKGIETIVRRAVERGEVPAERATPRAVRVAIDLVRHDVMMRLGSIPDSAVVEIVDQVAVPLLTGKAPQARPAG